MPDPLPHWLRPGPSVPSDQLAAALARALLPPEAPDAPPGWLRPDQRLSFARTLAAVRGYRGALLADPVGTGKTYIGLAVASALGPGRPIHVIAPASLLPQWRSAAERVGLNVLLHSHELLSRRRAPSRTPGVVLIDESQRFRTPTIQRYLVLADFCLGRRGVLLSATPVVNRLEDLSHQLLLLIRDDALGWAGLASLLALSKQQDPSALAHLVVTGEDRTSELPGALRRTLEPEEPAESPQHPLLAGILELALSSDRGIASLLRSGLLLALASSPLAAADALGRYRALLQHAGDAACAGHSVSRQTIRRFVGSSGGAEDQLVFWPLVAESGEAQPAGLALEDLEPVLALERAARKWAAHPDVKVSTLRGLLADRRRTLLFTQARATVHYLRRQLAGLGIAWCTGDAAGAGALELPREDVLDWFRRPVRAEVEPLIPWVLLATDVASEGLDLPLLRRVVHYDLPWTAVRLAQRSGRAFRLGSRERKVEIVQLLPPRAIERLLGQERCVARKAELPARLGLEPDSADAPWRVRARLASEWAGVTPLEGVAATSGTASGAVAGFRIVLSNGVQREVVLARRGAAWSRDLGDIAGLLERRSAGSSPPCPGQLRAIVRAVAPCVRIALQRIHARQLSAAPGACARPLARRLIGLARAAARERNPDRLALLGRGLEFVRRGHSAGETRLLAGWLGFATGALLTALRNLPEEPPPATVERVELIGILLVESELRTR